MDFDPLYRDNLKQIKEEIKEELTDVYLTHLTEVVGNTLNMFMEFEKVNGDQAMQHGTTVSVIWDDKSQAMESRFKSADRKQTENKRGSSETSLLSPPDDIISSAIAVNPRESMSNRKSLLQSKSQSDNDKELLQVSTRRLRLNTEKGKSFILEMDKKIKKEKTTVEKRDKKRKAQVSEDSDKSLVQKKIRQPEGVINCVSPDKMFHSPIPTNKKIRSKIELINYLKQQNSTVEPDLFEFNKTKLKEKGLFGMGDDHKMHELKKSLSNVSTPVIIKTEKSRCTSLTQEERGTKTIAVAQADVKKATEPGAVVHVSTESSKTVRQLRTEPNLSQLVGSRSDVEYQKQIKTMMAEAEKKAPKNNMNPEAEHKMDERPKLRPVLDTSGKVVVKGIPKEASFTEANLEKEFAPYGRITEVSIIQRPRTNQPRGFAFIPFENPQDASKALEGKNLEGETPLHCEQSVIGLKRRMALVRGRARGMAVGGGDIGWGTDRGGRGRGVFERGGGRDAFERGGVRITMEGGGRGRMDRGGRGMRGRPYPGRYGEMEEMHQEEYHEEYYEPEPAYNNYPSRGGPALRLGPSRGGNFLGSEGPPVRGGPVRGRVGLRGAPPGRMIRGRGIPPARMGQPSRGGRPRRTLLPDPLLRGSQDDYAGPQRREEYYEEDGNGYQEEYYESQGNDPYAEEYQEQFAETEGYYYYTREQSQPPARGRGGAMPQERSRPPPLDEYDYYNCQSTNSQLLQAPVQRRNPTTSYIEEEYEEATPRMTAEQFERLRARGPPPTVNIIKRPRTNQPRGFAFINFENPQDASKALEGRNLGEETPLHCEQSVIGLKRRMALVRGRARGMAVRGEDIGWGMDRGGRGRGAMDRGGGRCAFKRGGGRIPMEGGRGGMDRGGRGMRGRPYSERYGEMEEMHQEEYYEEYYEPEPAYNNYPPGGGFALRLVPPRGGNFPGSESPCVRGGPVKGKVGLRGALPGRMIMIRGRGIPPARMGQPSRGGPPRRALLPDPSLWGSRGGYAGPQRREEHYEEDGNSYQEEYYETQGNDPYLEEYQEQFAETEGYY